jgi:phage terminase large subunit
VSQLTVQLDYVPRAAFVPFHSRTQRRALLVVHRRGGKTVSCVNDLVEKAQRSLKPDAFYAYVGPYAKQTAQVAWKYLKEAVRRIPGHKIHETKKQVEVPSRCKGSRSTIGLFGADNPDSLRGMYFDGIVLDEVADMKSSVWNEVIQPALMDRHGWAVFIGTPKGKGFFYKMYEKARGNPAEWYVLLLKASVSGLLDQKELDNYRSEVDDDTYEQEMECSFAAGIRGSYWAKQISEAEDEGRLDDFPVVNSQPVHISLDIGVRDATSAWFFQIIAGELRVVDFQEWTNSTAHYILPEIKEKGYKIGDVWMPHDGLHRHWESERTASQVVAKFGYRVRQVPDVSVQQGIQAVRALLPSIRFAGARCYQGIESLKSYQRVWSDRLDCFSNNPLHDESSHAADSFRYLTLAVRDKDIEKTKVKPKNSTAPTQVRSIAVAGQEEPVNTTNIGWTFNDFMKSNKRRPTYQRI